MKRTAIWIVWGFSVVLAFLAGRFGARLESPSEAKSAAIVAAEAQPPVPAGDSAPAQPIRPADALALARRLIREGQPFEALAVVEAHLLESDRDAQALFLLSDLLQMTGDPDGALDPLLEILRFPPTPEVAERARTRLDLLINAQEQQLINAGDLVSLVAFFERLVLAEPSWDGHRLRLARWLARSGELEEGARVLREVGTNGVSQAEIDALEREIDVADSTLPVERQGGALFTRGVAAGNRRSGQFRFLIDTGATMTGLSEQQLVALGAERIRERVRVHTASGTVELPVFRLQELSVGDVVLRDLSVLGFAKLPGHADGLLGMDVLDRLSGGLPGTVGRPGNPR